MTLHSQMSIDTIIALSPDGTVLATASGGITGDNQIELWDVSTGKYRDAITVPDGLNSIAFSPDGKTLAVGSGNWPNPNVHVELWDVAGKRKTASFGTAGMDITGLSFSADGASITAGDQTATFHRWDCGTGKLLAQGGGGRFVSPVAVSSGGRFAAAVTNDDALNVFDAVSGKLISAIAGDPVSLASLAFSRDGTRLYGAGSISYRPDQDQVAGTTLSWDTRTGQLVNLNVTDNGGAFSEIEEAACADAVGASDGHTSVWQLGTSPEAAREIVKLAAPWELGPTALSPDGSILAVASSHDRSRRLGFYSGPPLPRVGRLDLWNIRSGRKLSSLATHDLVFSSLHFAPGGKTLVSTTSDPCSIDTWDVATGSLRRRLPTQDQDPTDIAISPSGQWVFVDGVVYDVARGRILRDLSSTAQYELQDTVFSADSHLMAAIDDNGVVRVWDCPSFRQHITWTPRMLSGARGLALSSDGRRLAFLDAFGSVEIWDVRSGELSASLRAFGRMGADPNARDTDGQTPLMFARSCLDQGPLFDALISRGADVNARDNAGETALLLICKSNDMALVDRLLENGANPNLADHAGNTPLIAASDHSEILSLLLDYKADPNQCLTEQYGGRCPLDLVAQNGDYTSVKDLIKHGAKVNVGSGGYTPLYYAVGEHDATMVGLLIAHGADFNVQQDGKTLLQLAKDADPSDEFGVARLLKTAGEKQ
jgi:WD40 repeat protein